MKILIDEANVDYIREMMEYYPTCGVTTNPTILSRSTENPYKTLKEIRKIIGDGGDLHVQVVSTEFDDVVVEAKKIVEELGGDTYIKIPVHKAGLKAIRELSMQGVNVTATSVYTHMQGCLAAAAGAKYVIPYVNRIDNLGFDGVKVSCDIHDAIKATGLEAQVLAASFKNTQQVWEILRHGVENVTVARDVLENMIKSDATVAAVKKFREDFEGKYGLGMTMINSK